MTGQAPTPPSNLALFTDLYELTMGQAYAAEGMDQPAVFELFFRTMPPRRNFLVAAGIEDVLDYLEQLHFTHDDLAYLRSLGRFSESFLDRLKGLRFTGEVWAVPEGTLVFPHQPLVQVRAPLIEAQLVETYVLNQVHFQTVLASKAARVVLAAQGRSVVDFGSRRAHGVDAALKMARACYLAGAIGTSNLLAGQRYGIPVFGTMAHSYIQAHASELDAFEAFVREFPETTLLVDTYETLDGVRHVIELAQKLQERFRVRAVRLDSGNLGELARAARRMLDEAGLSQVGIFASSGLDEYEIQRLVGQGAPIDAFGVGTKLAVSEDAPALDMAYKLVEYAGIARTKRSTGKVLLPGRKQIYRQWVQDQMVEDVLAAWDEDVPGQPLLVPRMQDGHRTVAPPPISDVRQYVQQQLAALPDALRQLDTADPPYPVQLSPRLKQQSSPS
jgi:nicotinate phosphoribosyltransferase